MSVTLPKHLGMAEAGVPSMVTKAYRWVREMEEIGKTVEEEGGWSSELFRGAAGVFGEVAKDATLKEEKAGERERGTTVDTIQLIRSNVSIPICVGGGIKTVHDAQRILDAGADKVI